MENTNSNYHPLRSMAQTEIKNLIFKFNILRNGPLTQAVIDEKEELTRQVNELMEKYNL